MRTGQKAFVDASKSMVPPGKCRCGRCADGGAWSAPAIGIHMYHLVEIFCPDWKKASFCMNHMGEGTLYLFVM